ncbi:MAG: TIGR03546 family protein [Deltaproteobacteria bacterium]|nr:TIGR03546 family protein [Deltaproteobacteria bacterium]
MIRTLAKVLVVLNSETAPAQISLAVCLSMVAGLTPLLSLHNILVFFLVLVLRVNLSSFILGLAFFTTLAYALDPLFHFIGVKVLAFEGLRGLWTSLYNITIFRLSNFYNSIVMGSILFSLVLFIPLLLTLNLGIRKYREHVLSWIAKTPLMQAIMASKFYEYYMTLSKLRSRL